MTHDYHAKLSTRSNLLDQGNLDEARAFYQRRKNTREITSYWSAPTCTTDAVLNQKVYIGQQQGIDIRFRVNNLSALNLPRVDAIIVLANQLDNSIEVCSQMPKSERRISVHLLYNKGILSISITNPSRPIQIVGGHISTTKPELLLHGFGFRNVEGILYRYQAEYIFSSENGRFIFTADRPDTKR